MSAAYDSAHAAWSQAYAAYADAQAECDRLAKALAAIEREYAAATRVRTLAVKRAMAANEARVAAAEVSR